MNTLAAARLAYKVGSALWRSAAARATMTKMAGREAIRQVARPVNLLENTALVAMKPIKVASVVYGAKEFHKELKRQNGDKDAEAAKPFRNATTDGARTALKGLGFAAGFAFMNRRVWLAALATSAVNSGATGRTLARIVAMKDANRERALGTHVATGGPTGKGAQHVLPSVTGVVHVRQHTRIRQDGKVEIINSYERHPK